MKQQPPNDASLQALLDSERSKRTAADLPVRSVRRPDQERAGMKQQPPNEKVASLQALLDSERSKRTAAEALAAGRAGEVDALKARLEAVSKECEALRSQLGAQTAAAVRDAVTTIPLSETDGQLFGCAVFASADGLRVEGVDCDVVTTDASKVERLQRELGSSAKVHVVSRETFAELRPLFRR